MPGIGLHDVPAANRSDDPPPFAAAASGRLVRDLSAAGGLRDFTATHVRVPPGGWSSQRHWHEREDDIAAVLVDDHGRQAMRWSPGGGYAAE